MNNQIMENKEEPSFLAVSSEKETLENNTETPVVEDNRILCTNSHSLDKILQIAIENVTELAESQNLGDHKAQFVSRFTEIFINSMQENLTVNGLPWIVNKEKLSKTEKEQQQSETNDAILSKLSKTVEAVTRKRKKIPSECRRIYSMKLKLERQNLKKAKISHNITMPSISSLPSITERLDLVTEDEFLETYSSIESLQEQVQAQLDLLQETQKNADIAKDIVQSNKLLCKTLSDTGYTSE